MFSADLEGLQFAINCHPATQLPISDIRDWPKAAKPSSS